MKIQRSGSQQSVTRLEELLAEQHWRNWDTFFSDQFRNSDMRLTEERWKELVDGFDPGFWAHVKEAVFGN